MNSPLRGKSALIRADGSKTIGMGHLSRASLIAGALEARGASATIVVRDDADADRFLAGRPGTVQKMPKNLSFDEELQRFRGILTYTGASIFVLDALNYADYGGFLRSLKGKGCKTAVIFDEIEQQKVEADVVLNGNPWQAGHDYTGYPGTYLTGPRYFLMDPRYANATVQPPQKTVRNVLLTVGGSDHNNLLFKLIAAFEALNEKYRVTIVSTSSTGYVDRLKARLAASGLSHDLVLDAPSLLTHWASCDAAITAGGNTLFERIATRLPGATVCQLDLQMKIADKFEEMGVNLNLGRGVDLDVPSLTVKLKTFLNDAGAREKQYLKADGVVDGRGLEHLMRAIAIFP